jgi:hypothetical protein
MLRRVPWFDLSACAVTTTAGLLVAGSIAVAAPRTWDANGASPPNGTFGLPANWNPDIVPIAGDTVTFGSGGSPYTVTFAANATSDSATISIGTVNWRSDSATPRTYDLTTGAADLIVRDSSGTLNIGATGNPMVVNTGDTVISAGVGPPGQANFMTLAGPGTSLTTGTLTLGDFDVKSGFLTVRESATLAVTGTTSFAPGTLTIDGGLVTLNTLNVLGGGVNFVAGALSYVGNLTVGTGGLLGSNLTLNSNRTLALSGLTTVAAANTLTLNGGSLTTGALTGSGALNFSSGMLTVTGAGGLVIAPGTPTGANLALGAGRTLNVANTTTIDAGSSLMLDGGTLNTGSLAINGDFVFNRGTLGITQLGGSVNAPIVSLTPGTTINVNANLTSLGSASSFAGFHHLGVLNVGANTVTLNSASYARLGVLTTLAGGTINAPNGVALPSGSTLQGSGTITTRVAGERGALIEAGGALTMGDNTSPAAPAGFNYAGELRTKQFTVTLQASAAVGLGNLTTMGFGGVPGTLNAANGFVVDFDEAVTGYGTINSINTLAKRATINGNVQGSSLVQPITLSGYVGGVGTFNNVSFTGTYSPGFSPAITMVGNIIFSPTSTLVMEIGGLSPGSEHDQIISSGQIGFDGTMQVSLINSFSPTLGQEFNLFDWVSTSGSFDTINLPPLGASLAWDTSQLYIDGTLSIASANLDGDFNHDSAVNAADYVAWRKGVGLASTPENYNLWSANFGRTSAGNGSSHSSVPEPMSGNALVLCVLTMAAWRQSVAFRQRRSLRRRKI